jgi:hypothetical protein
MVTKRRALYALILAPSLIFALASCSFFGWGPASEQATVTLSFSMATPAYGAIQVPAQAGSRALSGAGGSLQVPDFSSYKLTVSAADMDPISQSFTPPAAISVKVPVGTARTFTIVASTTQMSFTGSTTMAIAASTTAISVTLAIADNDLIMPVSEAGTGRLVRASLDASGVITARSDVLATELRDYNLAAFSPALPSPFVASDAALDAEGFVYLSEGTDAAAGTSLAHIVKIRDADNSATVASDIFYAGAKATGSAATSGIATIAIDKTNGWLYFARAGENRIYKKSLIIVDPSEGDQRAVALPITFSAGTIIALDCGPDGSLYVLRTNGGPFALEKYAATPVTGVATGTAPSPSSTATTLPVSPIDVQVVGSYVYVLASASPVIQRYDLADLAAAPTTGGVVGTGTSAGTFEGSTRFLIGPAGRVFVQISTSGGVGEVSFTDLAGWVGWSYQDALP